MLKYKTFIFILFTFFAVLSIAQPSFIYNGGSGNGYQSLTYEPAGITFLWNGGNGNGYSAIELKSSVDNYLTAGGDGNGYILSKIVSPSTFLFQGGNDDGYELSVLTSAVNTFLYEGGIGNGYDMHLNLREFIWTGAVGTGWNVAENWNSLQVPDITRRVIIPADATNWPFVNAGIFAIGENPNLGVFTASQVWIQENAQLVTRVNNYVENYGVFLIDGVMEVRNPVSSSFFNSGDGQIIIGNLGQLIFTSE